MVRWQYNDVRYALYVDELLDNAARARTKGLSHTIHLVGHFFADGNSIIQPPRLFNAQDTERVIRTLFTEYHYTKNPNIQK